jgi:hypothetical protein
MSPECSSQTGRPAARRARSSTYSAQTGSQEGPCVTDPVIETLGLRKEFRTRRATRLALDRLDL